MTKHCIRAILSALALLAILACQQDVNPTQPVGAQPQDEVESPVAARINDRAITVDEIDDYIKEELFARATSNGDAAKLYEVRSQAAVRYRSEEHTSELQSR